MKSTNDYQISCFFKSIQGSYAKENNYDLIVSGLFSHLLCILSHITRALNSQKEIQWTDNNLVILILYLYPRIIPSRALVAIAIILFSVKFSSGQQLTENKIDEFTGDTIKRTSWERICNTTKLLAYTRISKINGHFYFDVKVSSNIRPFSIDKGEKLMFKLANGDVYTLYNCEYKLSFEGEGSIGNYGSALQGVNASYHNLGFRTFTQLYDNEVIKIRVYINDGYFEEEVTPEAYEKIKNEIKLIQ